MNEPNQNEPDGLNKEAAPTSEELWNEDTYAAWTSRFGTPAEAAEKLSKDPAGSCIR